VRIEISFPAFYSLPAKKWRVAVLLLLLAAVPLWTDAQRPAPVPEEPQPAQPQPVVTPPTEGGQQMPTRGSAAKAVATAEEGATFRRRQSGGRITPPTRFWCGFVATLPSLDGHRHGVARAKVLQDFPPIDGLYLFRFPPTKRSKTPSGLPESAEVLYAQPNFKYYPSVIPNDPCFTGNVSGTSCRQPRHVGLHNTGGFGGTSDADIDAPEAWDITTGSPTWPWW
jgi:hypothetical protein